ncbi:MAG: chemotaxis protein CheA [Treponema sp.]|nr:chemotaxis protein CheA [Treponema sp.]
MADDRFIETFREEALELLGTLEHNLLELEENPHDPELVSAVFRVMHTIKGSAGMFGLERISGFAHQVESILTALREGRLAVSRDLINKTLESRDMILAMLDDPLACAGPVTPEDASFLEAFRAVVGVSEDKKEEKTSENKKEQSAFPRVWRIHFAPGKDAFRSGANPLSTIQELTGLGETVVVPVVDNLPTLADINPEDCVTAWEIFLTTTATENEIRDVFIFMEGVAEITITCLNDLIDENTPESKKLGELLVKEKLVKPVDLQIALEEQNHLKKAQRLRTTAADMSTIRVKSEKLDELMALVGELVTNHARIQQSVSLSSGNDELVAVVEQFGRLADELRNNTMSIRMVPIGTTFTSFKRLVHDLSAELGKKVELVAEGGETELDKTVIEKLNDPLVHIIRNSLDHGIETPEERKEHGKSETGTIRLSASQNGALVYVQIEDDGHGLDSDKIRSKAIARGIIGPDDNLSEQDLHRLIFAPGFSTKDAVTEVSGRGVGMDVVNRQMEMINGSVDVESSLGVYTQITLKIPLTLAIIDGLLVRIGNDSYVVPLSSVVGCMEYIRPEGKNEQEIVIFHDRQLPFINMRRFFSVEGERPAIEQMVVVSVKDQQTGLLVDQVLGSNQTVVKPIGKLFRRAQGISSASILGDGSVALILDIEQIFTESEKAAT